MWRRPDIRVCDGAQLLVLTSSERVMGKVFVNSIQTNVLASLMAALVVGINCYLVRSSA